MAQSLPKQIDGNSSFLGGMDEGFHSSIIQPNQSKRNINVTVRNGSISARPFYCELSDFTFINGDGKAGQGFKTYKEIFAKGRLQHDGRFNVGFNDRLLLVISGIIYIVDIDRCEIIPIELSGTINPKILNYKCTRINGTQAYDYYILFDWPNNPIYIDSKLKAQRTDTARLQIPRSYIGTFVHNRLFVGNAGTEFGASDPVGPVNTTSYDPYLIPPLSFTDTIVDSGINPSPPFADQFFSTSYIEATSNITAMGYFYATTRNSGTGYGPLFISTDKSIQVFPVNQIRSNWENGFGQVIAFDKGIVGQKAYANVGDDVFYQSTDCQIYSLKQLVSDQGQWGHVDLSREVSDTVRTKNKHLIKYADLEYYNNRLYVTAKPCITQAIDPYGNCIEDYSFNALAVMEFHGASGLSGKSGPVWAGIYPGSFNCLINVGNSLVSIGKDKSGTRNQLKLIKEEKGYSGDTTSVGNVPVRSRVYTKSYDFGYPLSDKNLQYVVADFRNIKSSFKGTVYYRVDPTCKWVKLGDLTHKCDVECGIIKGLDTKGEALCASDNSDEDTCFKCIEFRIDISSWDNCWELVKFYVVATRSQDVVSERELDCPLDECDPVCREMAGDLELWD